MTETTTTQNDSIQQFDGYINSDITSESLSEENINELTNRLHECLDFYQLFDAFINELKPIVAFDSVEYRDKATETTIISINGTTGIHQCEYNLVYEGESLGEFRITRGSKFLEKELGLIEMMLAGLSLPLKNAIKYQQAMHYSQRDELTGLRNTNYYQDVFDLEIERANRYKNPFSLVMINLDDFDSINIQFGRHAGDAILQEVAKRIEKIARASDVVYRHGGDEFLVFLPHTNKQESRMVAQRIKDYVLNDSILYNNESINLTLSAGVVTVINNDTSDLLLKRANNAKVHAKSSGKNRVCAETCTDCKNQCECTHGDNENLSQNLSQAFVKQQE